MYKIMLIVLAGTPLIFWGYPDKQSDPLPISAQTQEIANTTGNSEIISIKSSETLSANAKIPDEIQPAGDAQGLFEVAEQLYFCKSVPKKDTELAWWLDNARQAGEPDSYIDNIVGRYEQCAKYAQTEQNYLVLLNTAAEQGADDAVALLWSLSDAEYFESMNYGQLTRDETITNRVKFTEKKFALAHAAALRGGEKSLSRLIRGYQHFDPVTKGQSYYKAVAYADFALATTLDNDFYRKIDWIKQRLVKKMSDDELEQARILTEKLLAEAADSRN